MDVSQASEDIVDGPSTEVTAEFMRVRDVNWADLEIRRAGVIPIYDDGINKWIGFGISRFSANITPIGGDFEATDHDLLSTAVREYNEEVGSNMRNIIEDSVYNCYAIKSNFTIQILLPVKEYANMFTPTQELYDMLWVTPKQLTIMSDNQQYVLPIRNREGSRGFSFSAPLRDVAKMVALKVNEGTPFTRVTSTEYLFRPKREVVKSSQMLITNIDKFKIDAQSQAKWSISSLTFDKNYFGLMRANRTLYLLPIQNLDEVMAIMNKLSGKIYVSNANERERIIKTNKLDKKLVNSIEHAYKSLAAKYSESEMSSLMKDFFKQLAVIRTQPEVDHIMNECILILESELELYDFIDKTGAFFNSRRACFLQGVNTVNRVLAHHTQGVQYWSLKQVLQKEQSCKEITSNVIINQMIALGLIEQNRETTQINLSIP